MLLVLGLSTTGKSVSRVIGIWVPSPFLITTSYIFKVTVPSALSLAFFMFLNIVPEGNMKALLRAETSRYSDIAATSCDMGTFAIPKN